MLAAIALGFAIAVAALSGAIRLGRAAVGELRLDVRDVAVPSALFLHVLLICLVLLLGWLALASAAAGWDIACSLRAGSPAPEPRHPRRAITGAGRHHMAVLLLALTGAGALGALPTATASAAPLPPGSTRSTPFAVVEKPSAMEVPVPAVITPPAPPTDPATADIPQPGWVTPAPSPTSQRCAAGARLITGCPSREESTQVVVHRGDSLWTLISRHLHTHDAAVIAAAVPHWYAANKAVIGSDPDLLRVGQRLHIPDPVQTTSATEHTNQGER